MQMRIRKNYNIFIRIYYITSILEFQWLFPISSNLIVLPKKASKNIKKPLTFSKKKVIIVSDDTLLGEYYAKNK